MAVMNILFISRELSGGDLCLRLQNEGHRVKLFVEEKRYRSSYEGMAEKIDDWKRELEWVGKEGLIVFDSTGYGKIQDRLRKKGYSVVGGCELGDRLEDDRTYGQKVLSACGIPTLSSMGFHNIDDAIAFVEKEKGMWVIKQNGHASKTFNYVGQLESGQDVLQMLRNYKENNKRDSKNIELQRRVKGAEIGIGRYFNGHDWVGPIEMNVEHKGLFVGGVGPKTSEMGTLTWYDNDDENNRLFQETIGKLKGYLEHAGFHGDIDINCIVNEDGIHPLEVTARFGFPAIQLQSTLHNSPWGEFLKAVADGKPYDLDYKKGFGIVVLVATPPFPYTAISRRYSMKGSTIYFSGVLTPDEWKRIHFEDVSRVNGWYILSNSSGYVAHVSGFGKTIQEAREQTYALVEKIIIPKKFYRNDIGLKFAEKEQDLLKQWGWLE